MPSTARRGLGPIRRPLTGSPSGARALAWSAGVALWLASTLGTGCAVHEVGLVHASGATTLETPSGHTYRLVLTGEATPIAYLDGHITDVHGRRAFKTITVTDWSVPEGLHGLPAFVGILEEKGIQLGLVDRNAKAWMVFDAVAGQDLRPYVGLPVLVEGYVDGPQRVRVMYYRVLAKEGGRP